MVLSFSTALMLTALFTWKNSAARRVIYGPSARNLSLTLCLRTICGVNRNRLIFRQNTAWQLLTPAVTAGLVESYLDVTADTLAVELDTAPNDGRLLIELRNDDCKYRAPGQDGLALLRNGSQLECNLGYVTAQGKETNIGPVFWLDSWEHASAGGKSSLTLQGVDGWQLLKS